MRIDILPAIEAIDAAELDAFATFAAQIAVIWWAYEQETALEAGQPAETIEEYMARG